MSYYFIRFSDVFRTGLWKELSTEDPSLQELSSLLPEYCLKSRADSTQRKYRYAFDNFCKWCSCHNITPLPASEYNVSLYLIYLSKKHNSSAKVDEAFYAINWSHRLAGLPSPCKTDLCNLVKEGANRQIGHYIANKKEPITSTILHKVVLKFGSQGSTLYDIRTCCMCLLSYAGFLRFSELVNLKKSDIEIYPTHVSLFLEKSKTDKLREGTHVLIARTNTTTCPVSMLERYLQLACITEASHFIFRSLTFCKNSNVYKLKGKKSLSYTRAREVLLETLESVGLDKSKFGLHSLRSGGATAAANAGVDDRLFKKHGRWSSDTAKDGYVHENITHKLSVSKKLGI